MQTKLQQHFPMIQDREAILLKIRENRTMDEEFQSWTEEQREEFLDFCTGVRGIKFLYDGFFKEIFDPDATPERLEAFLSLFLGTRVKILEVFRWTDPELQMKVRCLRWIWWCSWRTAGL